MPRLFSCYRLLATAENKLCSDCAFWSVFLRLGFSRCEYDEMRFNRALLVFVCDLMDFDAWVVLAVAKAIIRHWRRTGEFAYLQPWQEDAAAVLFQRRR